VGRALKFALIAALPIEVANLLFFGIPLGVGLPSNSHWYSQLLGNLWLYMYLPSMFAKDRLGFLQAQPDFSSFVMFLSGYLATALLLLAAALCLLALRHLARTFLFRRA